MIRNQGSISGRSRDLFLSTVSRTGSVTDPASYPMDTNDSFSEVNWCEADQSPTTSAKVKNIHDVMLN
jgi:hypothetical protein